MSSRLRRKLRKLEQITGASAHVEERQGTAALFVDVGDRTWEQSGSVRELMMWIEGFIVGVRREQSTAGRSEMVTPQEVELS